MLAWTKNEAIYRSERSGDYVINKVPFRDGFKYFVRFKYALLTTVSSVEAAKAFCQSDSEKGVLI